MLIVHGSEPIPSDGPRIGIAIRYLAPHVRQVSGFRDAATRRPGRNMDDAAMAHYRRIVDRFARMLELPPPKTGGPFPAEPP